MTSVDSSVVEKTTGEKQRRIFKIIVLGDSNVGKTCLTFRFCVGKFPERTEATIGVDFREKNVYVEGENIKLQLWDTAGQERFRKSMVQHYYRNVHAVVFVYDVTKFADQHNMPLFETSAKDDSHADHVNAIFLTLAHKLKNHKPMMPNKPSRVVLQKTVVEMPNQNNDQADGGCC